jgi:hypothetical protein
MSTPVLTSEAFSIAVSINPTELAAQYAASAQASANQAAAELATANGDAANAAASATAAAASAAQAAASAASMDFPIGAAEGGTGRTTLTAHGVLIGEGTAAVNSTAAGTAGQPLLSGGASADPAFGTLGIGAGGTGETTAAAALAALGAASSGANSSITSLSGLTTALSIPQGGTGATTAAGALTSLGAASSGANSSITSLSGLTTPLSASQGGTGATAATGTGDVVLQSSPTIMAPAISTSANLSGTATPLLLDSSAGTAGQVLTSAGPGATPTWTTPSVASYPIPVADGGTGATTAAGALTNLGAASSGANSNITSLTGLATPLAVPAAITLTEAVNVSQLFPSLSVSVASNALTGSLSAPTALIFRNPSLTSGVPVGVAIPTNLSLTVPYQATLGVVGGVTARLVWLVAYNGGTPALCVVNLNGAPNLDETTLISTTAISTSATSAGVIYSSAAITSSPFRVIGFSDVNEATAGTWPTAPTTVQGVGGEAMASLSSFGFGQTYQSIGSSRAQGTTYYNATGKPIWVYVVLNLAVDGVFNVTLNGVQEVYTTNGQTNANATGVGFPVFPGWSYSVSGGTSIYSWYECR